MTDAFNREVSSGDMVARITDWGSGTPMIIVGTTPAGYLRSIIYNSNHEEFRKNSILRNTSNVVILDETLLRAMFCDEEKTEQYVQAYLEEKEKYRE